MCSRKCSRPLAVLAVVAAAVCHPPAVRAIQGFRPIDPEELKMTSEPLAPGAPAIILYRQVDRDDSGRTPHEDSYVRIKILREEGLKYADVEIEYFRESGFEINGIKARTINPDGSVIDFAGKIFDKSIVKAKGLRYQAKTFTLPAVQVGSIVEYYYTEDLGERYIYDSHWILSQDLFTKRVQFSLKPFHSDYRQLGVRWVAQGLPAGTANAKQGTDGVIRMTAGNIPAFQTEDFMPPENEMKERVDFIYAEGPAGTDASKFWAETGKQWNGALQSFIGKHKAMEKAVAEIVAPGDSPEVQLRKIYARVQQMRNTSYEVQKTEQEEKREKEKVVRNAEDVWNSESGSGADLTWLFLGLAKAAGFEAYGVWVSDRRRYFFSPVAMDEHQLDANVVLVKLNGKDLYLDPGAKFAPFGLLPWEETGVQGLKLDKDDSAFVQTTLPDSSVSRIERAASLKLSDAGDLEGKLTVTFTGIEAMKRRVEERDADQTARKEYLEGEVKEFIPAACDPDLVNQPDWTNPEQPLVAEFNLKVPGWASLAGSRVLVPVGLFSASEKHLFDTANRLYPIYLEFPSKSVDDVTLELPPGWEVADLPSGQDKEGRVVNYKLSVENNGGKLHWNRMLDKDLIILDKKYYIALRSFFQLVKTTDDEQIILRARATASN